MQSNEVGFAFRKLLDIHRNLRGVKIYMDFDGLRSDITQLLGGGRVRVNTRSFQNDMRNFRTKDDILTLLIHLGYLGYDAQNKEVFIPNKEIIEEYENAMSVGGWPEVMRVLKASGKLLEDTLNGDAKSVAALDQAHTEIASILTYNDENSLGAAIGLAYYSARKDYRLIRELPAGHGFADIIFLPLPSVNRPAFIVGLKYDKTAPSALQQVKDRQLTQAREGYSGEILRLGIHYDKKRKRNRTAVSQKSIAGYRDTAVSCPHNSCVSSVMIKQFDKIKGRRSGEIIMYAFADKTEQKKKANSVRHHSTASQGISVPGYVFGDLPQRSGLGNACGIVQRYPVRVEDGKIVSTAKRPSVPDAKGFRTQLIDRSYDGGYRNPFEMDLQAKYPDKPDAAKIISHKGGYRSREECAFCHKVSISDIEDILVEYANDEGISSEFIEYLNMINFDTERLEEIRKCVSLDDKAAKVNQFICEINRLPGNYYIGDANTNSMLGARFDPHVDFETGRMSPVSWFAYEHQEKMGITPAKSDGYGGFYSSSLPH